MTAHSELPSNRHRGIRPLWMDAPRIVFAAFVLVVVTVGLRLWGDGSAFEEPLNRFWNRHTQRYNLNLPAPGEYISIAAVATSVVIVSLGISSAWLKAWLVVNAIFLVASLLERSANESKRRKYNEFLDRRPPAQPFYK